MDAKEEMKFIKSLGKCREHNSKFLFICLASNCTQNKILCHKCSLSYHQNCRGQFILLEDIERQKYDNDFLKYWIPHIEFRKYLEENSCYLEENNIDASHQKLLKKVDEVFDKITNTCMSIINNFKNEYKERVLNRFQKSEFRNIFKEYFSFNKLMNLISSNITNMDELNKKLEAFFKPRQPINFNEIPLFIVNKNLNQYIQTLSDDLNKKLASLQLIKERSLFSTDVIRRFKIDGFGWAYNGGPDAVDFSASKELVLKGFGLYTGDVKNGMECKKADIKIMRSGAEIMRKKLEFINHESKIFTYFLDEWINISPGETYTVKVLIEGPQTYKGVSGIPVFNMSEETKLCFFNTNLSLNGTSCNVGQIPEFYFENPSAN